MLWGTASDHTGNWHSLAQKAIDSGSKHLLAFNEPDLPAQSNLSPADAAAGYKTYMQPFAGKAKLGSPAVTNGDATTGMGAGWLSSFFDACSDCQVDFVAFHWYASDFEYFKQHINDIHTAAGDRPLWLTEFQYLGSEADQVAFLAQALPYLESLDYVERYSYFMVQDGSLVSGGALSALGKAFAG